MRTTFSSILFSFLILAACNNETKTDNKESDTTKPSVSETAITNPTSGPAAPSINDQGCDKSLGQRYSKILKGCVILVDLVTLQPKDPKLNSPAYLVFDSVRTEIFLSTQESSTVIRKTKSNPDVWENGPLKLSRTTTGYRLEDDGKLIYAFGE